MDKMTNIKIQFMKLYYQYQESEITMDEYIKQIRPLDKEIDKNELESLKQYLQGTLAFEKPSS